jgi:hypothetical protein
MSPRWRRRSGVSTEPAARQRSVPTPRERSRAFWRAQRFSWWMTSTLHRSTADDGFDFRRQLADLEYLVGSTAAMTSFAESYVGAPLTIDRDA